MDTYNSELNRLCQEVKEESNVLMKKIASEEDFRKPTIEFICSINYLLGFIQANLPEEKNETSVQGSSN